MLTLALDVMSQQPDDNLCLLDDVIVPLGDTLLLLPKVLVKPASQLLCGVVCARKD